MTTRLTNGEMTDLTHGASEAFFHVDMNIATKARECCTQIGFAHLVATIKFGCAVHEHDELMKGTRSNIETDVNCVHEMSPYI